MKVDEIPRQQTAWAVTLTYGPMAPWPQIAGPLWSVVAMTKSQASNTWMGMAPFPYQNTSNGHTYRQKFPTKTYGF